MWPSDEDKNFTGRPVIHVCAPRTARLTLHVHELPVHGPSFRVREPPTHGPSFRVHELPVHGPSFFLEQALPYCGIITCSSHLFDLPQKSAGSRRSSQLSHPRPSTSLAPLPHNRLYSPANKGIIRVVECFCHCRWHSVCICLQTRVLQHQHYRLWGPDRSLYQNVLGIAGVSSIPDLYPLDASRSPPPPLVTTKGVSRHCPMSSGGEVTPG